MTFTDEQLWAAVRSAGRDGKAFTCADLRDALGMSTNKRQELSKFRDRFRAFRLASGPLIEKVGKTEYRIREASGAPRAAARAKKAVPVAVESVATEPVAAETVAAETVEVIPVVVEMARAPEPPAVFETAAAPEPPAVFETVVAPELLEALDALEPAAVDEVVAPEPVVVEMLEPQRREVEAVVATQPLAIECESVMQVTAEEAALAAELSEELIEAEVRSLISVPEISTDAPTVDTLMAQAEQSVMRTWRDRGQWLSRRFAGLFARS